MLSVKHFPLLIAILGLAACQPLPQPFQANSRAKATNTLMRPVGETSMFVAPAAGLPEDQGRALAEALAVALAEKDVPASATVRSRLSTTLIITLEPRGSNTAWRWSERLSDNSVLADQPPPLGLAVDRLGDPAVLTQVANVMAASIANRLSESLAVLTPVETGPAKLAVQECTGAPGDGNRALRQAMRELLILGGQPLQNEPAGADFVIACQVQVWADTANSERVSIEWILQSPDGNRLGQVKQANRIPKGQLGGAWGNTAHIVAQGGWQGLSEIIETRRRGNPALPVVKS